MDTPIDVMGLVSQAGFCPGTQLLTGVHVRVAGWKLMLIAEAYVHGAGDSEARPEAMARESLRLNREPLPKGWSLYDGIPTFRRRFARFHLKNRAGSFTVPGP